LCPRVFIVGGHVVGSDNIGFRRAHLFRPIYLLTLAYLIGYLGEHERRSKRKLGFMRELPAAFRRGRPPGRALSRLMRRTLDHFGADRGLLVLRDPESGRYFTWDVSRRNRRMRLGLRITEVDPVPLPFASETEGLLVNDLRPGAGTALCYDVLSGAIARKAIVPPLTLPEGCTAEAMLIAPVLIQHELRELEELHEAVDRGDREVRRYLAFLRESQRQEESLWTALDRLVAEFSARERLRVRVVRPPAAPALPPTTAHDLTQIVREAL